MHLIKTLSGSGNLHADSKPSPVEYRIQQYQDGALTSADGQVCGDDTVFFAAVMSGEPLKLDIEGGNVTIYITEANGSGVAKFQVTGPVP